MVTKNVFRLNKYYDLVLSGCIPAYDVGNDPGTLWVWGYNGQGQLGDGTITERSSPVQIPGTSWNDITGGSQHSLARKTDGTLWSWGYNVYGQLGDGTRTYRSSPVQIPGTSWNNVAGGSSHSLARKTDGTLWAWGVNEFGQLGDGTKTYRSSPIQIPGTSWNDIATSAYGCHHLARKS